MGCTSSQNNTGLTLTIPPIIQIPLIEDLSYQHFKKISLLGRGAFGKVYLIKSKETDKEYSLKEININGNK